MTGGGRANWEERKPDHAPRPAGSYRQNCHPQLSNAENDARRTNWFPVLRFTESIVLSGSWAGVDLATIPRTVFEVSDFAIEGRKSRTAEPKPDDELATRSPNADSPTPASRLPPRPARATSRFQPLTLSEMADLPPPEWLMDGLVPEDGLVVLYGRTRTREVVLISNR
jgi:hypothetical protein